MKRRPIRYLFASVCRVSRQLFLLCMIVGSLVSVVKPVVFADDPCALSASSPVSTSGLSACQKQIYQSGINYFDIATGDASSCVVATSADFSGSDYVESAFNALNGLQAKDTAISPVGAAAIVGNMMWESGGASGRINPNAKNPRSGAYGIAQWLGGRYDNLKAEADKEGKPISDFGVQMNFLISELKGSENAAVIAIAGKTDVADATFTWEDTFERAGESRTDSPMKTRIAHAQAVYDKYGDSQTAVSDQLDPAAVVAAVDSTGNCSASAPGEETQFVDGFTVYSQYDPAWKDKPYGTSTIGDSGCGPSAMAMIITALTGKTVTPLDTADYAGSHGMYIPGAGSSHALPTVVAPHWGLKATPVEASVQKITAVLSAGGLVIGSATGPLPYTSAGHYITIRAATAEGKWKIGDSAHKESNTKDWDPQDILGPIISSGHQGSLYAITKDGVNI